MAEIDPVIVQLRADVANYQRDLGRAAQNTQKLEKQVLASTTAISNSFSSLALPLAGAFSASTVENMADAYTRFTNSLKVAGLEGQALTGVQERLFGIAQKNGIELEAVGQLYSRAAQNQKELNASSEDLISLTRAVSASLRISGTSTEEASGALLQLGQALGSPRIQAEEFNSLLDTMQPLLREASKYIDGTGNSLSGLTRVIKDTSGAGVSNVQFFEAINKAMASLEETASKSSLTISAAFTNLSNAMSKFVGEADKANGASATITQALQSLANNLDTVANAIAVIAAVMIGKYSAAAIAATVGTLRASVAANTTTASFNSMTLATTRASGGLVAVGAAGRAAGAGLLAAVGGPVGVAIAALTLGIGYLASSSMQASAASQELSNSIDAQAAKFELLNTEKRKTNAETDNLTKTERAALTATANLTGEAHLLANAWARVAAEAKNAAIEQAKALLSEARTNRVSAQNRVNSRAALDEGLMPTNPIARGLMAVAPGLYGYDDKAKAKEKKEVTQAIKNEAAAQENLNKVIKQGLNDFKQAQTATEGAKPKKKAGGTPKDAQAIANRFMADLEAGEMAIKEAQAAALGTAEARRGLEADRIEYERVRNAREIKADKDTSAAQKEQLLLLNERVAKEKIAALNAEALREALDRQKVSAENQAKYAEDALRGEADMARTRKDSYDINVRILEMMEKREAAELEALIAAEQIADAEKARADLARAQASRRSENDRRHESPMQQRRRELNDEAANINDAIENIQINAMDKFSDSIASASENFIKLGGVAGDVVNGIISDLVRLAARQAMMGLFGGDGGGGIGGFFGSLFKGARAAGGSVVGGTPYLVGENGPEVFRPQGSGSIIPNSQLRNMSVSRVNQGQQQVVIKVEANDYFDARVDSRAQPIASRAASDYSGASYAMSQRSAPSTMNKYNQLKG